LGGGIGWLMGRCGLACDNTLTYDVATAEGQLIQANADSHPDLFWALKGGGGNFGVVTSITYRLHPIHTIVSGMLLFPFSQGRDVLRRYRDFVSRDLPEELIVYAVAMRLPIGIRAIAILPVYCGDDLSKAQPWIDSLKQFGSVLADLTAPMPYVAMQQMLDAGVPHGIRSYWKSSFLDDLPDAAVDVFMDHVERCPSRQTFAILEHSHGAAARVPGAATTFSRRKEGLALVIFGLWSKAKEDGVNIAWTRNFHAAMRPWSDGSVYVNSLSEDESGRVREAYGENFERLRAIKAKYDPQNRFRHNQNIPPRAERKWLTASVQNE
jgi:FAD/FMN-containing dehydrogenase